MTEKDSSQKLLEAQALWFSYTEQKPALRGASIAVRPGEMLAIVGPNGAGKTTLAKHFNGLLRPDRGRVLFEGEDVGERSVAEMASKVGFVLQNPDHQIFGETVFDELAFGPRNVGLDEVEVKHRVDSLMAIFKIRSYAKAPPALLSFGLRRLISIASVLTMEPRVLILDEPTKGLDAKLTRTLVNILQQQIDANRSVVLITHDMALVTEHASRCALMSAGQIRVNAPVRDLFLEIDRWIEFGLYPTEVAQLASALRWSHPVLTVEEFCLEARHWLALKGGGDARRQ
jgi:energy-coupling factor transport system ATP-binding protein